MRDLFTLESGEHHTIVWCKCVDVAEVREKFFAIFCIHRLRFFIFFATTLRSLIFDVCSWENENRQCRSFAECRKGFSLCFGWFTFHTSYQRENYARVKSSISACEINFSSCLKNFSPVKILYKNFRGQVSSLIFLISWCFRFSWRHLLHIFRIEGKICGFSKP